MSKSSVNLHSKQIEQHKNTPPPPSTHIQLKSYNVLSVNVSFKVWMRNSQQVLSSCTLWRPHFISTWQSNDSIFFPSMFMIKMHQLFNINIPSSCQKHCVHHVHIIWPCPPCNHQTTVWNKILRLFLWHHCDLDSPSRLTEASMKKSSSLEAISHWRKLFF